MGHSMKPALKSALINGLFAALCLGLGACDRINWPRVYGPDEVPQAVRDEPRAIETLPPVSKDETYIRLGEVPSKPKDFSSPTTINKTKQQLEDDKSEAQVFKDEAHTPSIEPVPVTEQ